MSTAGVHDPARNYTLVGGFVLLMIVVGVVAVVLLSGISGSTDRYLVPYANVMGLGDGAPVSFQGYRVGRVESIGPAEDGGFLVEISVERGWPIPEDSVARMVASGLLAAVALDITAGESETLLTPGDRIQGRERDDVFSVVSKAASQLGDMIRSLDPLMTELSDGAPEIVANVRELTEQLNETATRLDTIVSDGNAKRVDAILAELQGASRSVSSLAAELKGTRADFDALLERVDGVVGSNQADLRQAVVDLRATTGALARSADHFSDNLVTASQNLVEFSDDIRRDPSVLVRGRSEGD